MHYVWNTSHWVMGISYNAGNDAVLLYEYKAEASDNMMEENSFNLYFLLSQNC